MADLGDTTAALRDHYTQKQLNRKSGIMKLELTGREKMVW